MRFLIYIALLTATSQTPTGRSGASVFPPPTASKPGYLLASFSAVGSTTLGTFNIFLGTTAFSFAQPGPPMSLTPTMACNTRDPSIINWGGTYLLSWTINNTTPSSCGVDNLHLPVSAVTSTTTWTVGTPILINVTGTVGSGGTAEAPEWFADPQNCTFNPNGSGWSCTAVSNLHLLFAGVSSGGAGQLYEMHPTASDFVTNTASWSTPVLLTVTGETNIVDPFMIWLASASKYYLFYAQKAGGTNCVNWATSTTLTGTYTDLTTNQCLGFADLEAPMVIQTVAGSPGTWIWCGDFFNNSFFLGQYYCEQTSNGFSSFFGAFELGGPLQLKHGTMIPFP